eukprot:s4776_g5.t2
MPRADVGRCIEAAVKACNGEAKRSQILQAVTIRLAYLENRKSLHAFAPEKVKKEVTTELQKRLEKLAGPDLANIKARIAMTSQPRRPDVQSLGGWKADDWARQLLGELTDAGLAAAAQDVLLCFQVDLWCDSASRLPRSVARDDLDFHPVLFPLVRAPSLAFRRIGRVGSFPLDTFGGLPPLSGVSILQIDFGSGDVLLDGLDGIFVQLPPPPSPGSCVWEPCSCSLRAQRSHLAWLESALGWIRHALLFAGSGRLSGLDLPFSPALGGRLAQWLLDSTQLLKELLGAELDFSQRPLQLATGCSGAEAPHFALRMLVGREGFQQLFGSDINETPRRFMLKNCKGQKHLFEDVKHVMEGRGSCARHGGCCPVPKEDVDIFIGGFPCTPYSFCNPKRFKRNCFTEPAAAPFFEMRKFIAVRRPRLVILENVRGLLAPNPETKDTPMDFILRGKNPGDPEHCYQGTEPGAQWGLSLIEGYGLHWDLLYSCDWGLPQRRPRVYIVMVREDAGGQEAADRIFEVLHACAGHLPCGSCNDFLYPEDHPRLNKAMQLAKGGSDSERKPCTPFTEALFKATRQEHGLDASERPYTNQRPRGWYPEATEKMVQQLDIIHALAEKRALDFKFLLADLSQQVSRGCWRDDGYVPTLTTAGSLYSFHHHRPIVGEECLRLNGFPVEELDIEGFTDNELKFLAGNAMSVSVVGAVLLASLVSVSWGEKRSAAVTKELPAPRDHGPRYRKKETGDKEVVLASLALDDDGSETELDPSESGTSARAAMLFLMAKELQAAKSEKGGGSSGTKRKRSTGQEQDAM